MGESLEAFGVAERAHAHIHGSSTLQQKNTTRTQRYNPKIAIKANKLERKLNLNSNLKKDWIALSVSGSLIRRTLREFLRTILLYSLLSVRAFTISTSSFPTAMTESLKACEIEGDDPETDRENRIYREEGAPCILENDKSKEETTPTKRHRKICIT
jgi:hypothetical protein